MATRILVFGTFDILHKGHLNFFRQARSFAKKPYLIVSVARSSNVKKIKGRLPLNSEKKRLKNIAILSSVDLAVLGAKSDYIGHILLLKPDIICLGYDQKHYTAGLSNKLLKRGLKVKIVKLKAYKPAIFKSSIVVKKLLSKPCG